MKTTVKNSQSKADNSLASFTPPPILQEAPISKNSVWQSEDHDSLKNYSVPRLLLPLLYLQLVSTNHKEDIDGQDPGGDVDQHAGKVEADEGQQDVDQPQHEPDPTPDNPRLHQTDFLLGNRFSKFQDQSISY